MKYFYIVAGFILLFLYATAIQDHQYKVYQFNHDEKIRKQLIDRTEFLVYNISKTNIRVSALEQKATKGFHELEPVVFKKKD